jgi:hypothetical protein
MGDQTLLLDQPDARLRTQKAVWRQLRGVLADVVSTALAEAPVGEPRVTLMCTDLSLGRILAVDLGRHVNLVDLTEPAGPPGVRDHVTVLVLPPGLPAGERIDHLRKAHRRLRPAGWLVVVATVVAAPGEQGVRPPSMSELIEELQRATGVGVTIEELRSLRWSNEPMSRGVVISATCLSTPRADEDGA